MLPSGQFDSENDDSHQETDQKYDQHGYPKNICLGADVDADNLILGFNAAVISHTFGPYSRLIVSDRNINWRVEVQVDNLFFILVE
jgi:hypothetical protein